MINLNEPSSDPANYKYGLFYYNKKDYRLVVPKINKMLGWTFNFARPGTYLFISLAVVIVWGAAKLLQ